MSLVGVAASFLCSHTGVPIFFRDLVCGVVTDTTGPHVCHLCQWCASGVFLELYGVGIRVGECMAKVSKVMDLSLRGGRWRVEGVLGVCLECVHGDYELAGEGCSGARGWSFVALPSCISGFTPLRLLVGHVLTLWHYGPAASAPVAPGVCAIPIVKLYSLVFQALPMPMHLQ